MEVQPDHVTILATAVEQADEIDIEIQAHRGSSTPIPSSSEGSSQT
jgi:F0F1-type ATP synthase epsilon subunit